ncbi:MAG: cysteine--tRNA ligase [Verrucomicrobiales bacterium]|nr:cysteine--tRNA ligase [Verrucomicrobiales bacterium]
MGLKIFNTLEREVVEFVPLDPAGKKVGMYCCGPTVYDFAHIGNFRTFVFTDLVRRYLDFKEFDVTHVMNITDVEDKIIRTVRESDTSLKEFTRRFEKAFLEDMDALGCKAPTKKPRATEYIGPIIKLIKKLVDRGVAYQASDGSVYFSIEKYRGCGCHYGQLVNLNFGEMRTGERVADDEYEKESLADFALWKARVPEDGEVFWKSPWGEGRPGWHIECSAMSTELLGKSFDLHLGGEDLKFPHHEDEIAQSEGAFEYGDGEHFVKFWMHGSHLLVEGKKMQKRLGNFFTLRDLTSKGYQPREIRYLMLSAHYREQFNFTFDGLDGARSALGRLDDCLLKLGETAAGEGTADSDVISAFERELDDDFNVAGAWRVVFDWIRDRNKELADESVTAESAANALATWEKINSVFGIENVEAPVPPEIQSLAEERQAARKAKDFQRSDEIRDQLAAQGWVIEDTPKGPRVKKA